jgi:hypothetical protein
MRVLEQAAPSNHVELARVLLAKGAKVNTADGGGLHGADSGCRQRRPQRGGSKSSTRAGGGDALSAAAVSGDGNPKFAGFAKVRDRELSRMVPSVGHRTLVT